MKPQIKLQAGAIALTLTAAMLLPISEAAAKPHHARRKWHPNKGFVWRKHKQNKRKHHKYRVHRRPSPGATLVRLPDGCRRVKYRDRVYYTRDDIYYTYNPRRQVYVVVDLGSLF